MARENTSTIGSALKWKYPNEVRICVSKIDGETGEKSIVQWEADIEQPSIAECETIMQEHIAWKDAQDQAKADLKASAKAKLMSGEALTEEEANTIVL